MTSIAGLTICSIPSALNYLEDTRVDPATNQCPGMKLPCSTKTSPENTICVHPTLIEQCPITFVTIVETSEDSGPVLPSEIQDIEYDYVNLTESKAIVYSKNTDNLPISVTTLENEFPCSGSSAYRVPSSHDQLLPQPRNNGE